MLAHTHRYLAILLSGSSCRWLALLQSSIGAIAFICSAVKHYLVVIS